MNVYYDTIPEFLEWLWQQDLTMSLDYLGTLAFAISGIRLASGMKIDWLGAYLIGVFTAVGGGTIRDLLLGLTPFWMETPAYVILTLLAFLIVVMFSKQLIRINEQVFLFDTIGLGLFTVVGIERTLVLGFPFWVAIIMGTITGAFGGVLRDISLSVIPLIFRKDIYALACVIGGLVYGALMLLGLESTLIQVISVIAVVATRFLAVRYNWKLPILKGDDS
ncbi:MAG: trimeric intracellular cation channel family protein [Porphyromonas sp.]|nr:trimeric intracellular cation channel family protein [Porphyromonas sp.]